MDDETPPDGFSKIASELWSVCYRPGCPLSVLDGRMPRGAYWEALWCVPCPAGMALHIRQDGRLFVWNKSLHLVFEGGLGFGLRASIANLGEERGVWIQGPGRRGFVRGLSQAEASALKSRLDGLTSRERVETVPLEELVSSPEVFHGRLICVSGIWERAFEQSRFAGAWLLDASSVGMMRQGAGQPGEFPVTVLGLWISEPNGRYGHLGAYEAVFIGYEMHEASWEDRR